MEPTNGISQQNLKNDEIDLLNFINTIWSNRIRIIRTTVCWGLIGLIIAFISPKEYTASMIMVPQTANSQSKLGNISSLAALAGINLSSVTNSDIAPKIFPQILSSPAFRLELMNSPLRFEGIEKPVSFYDYYTKIKKPNLLVKYTIGLPKIIMSAFKKKSTSLNPDHEIIEMTEDQVRVEYILAQKVSVTLNDEDGSIAVTGNMPEPLAAALLAKAAENLLQRYIIEFKIEKAKATHDFVQQRCDEARINLQKIQKERAAFRDQNKFISSARAKIEEEWLNTEFSLAMNVFSELAKQLELAKIQLKEETPIFTIVKPLKVPSEKSQPRTLLLLTVSLFLGFIVGTTLIFWRTYWKNIKKQWAVKHQIETANL